MSYFRHKKNTIEIDDQIFDEKLLKLFDPKYSGTPKGWVRCYIQGRKHYLTNGTNQIGCDFPWEEGDRYIRSLPELKFLEKQINLDEETSIPTI